MEKKRKLSQRTFRTQDGVFGRAWGKTIFRIFHGSEPELGLAEGYEAKDRIDEAVAFRMENR